MKSEKFFTVTDVCIDCGICTYVCPRGNYELTSRGVTTSGDCEFCFACIQNCPPKAIQFIKQEDGSFPDGTEDVYKRQLPYGPSGSANRS